MMLKKICLLAAVVATLSACGTTPSQNNPHAAHATTPGITTPAVKPQASPAKPVAKPLASPVKPATAEPEVAGCPYTDCMSKVGEAGLNECMRAKGYGQP
ncbi:hypothetical protein [Geopseudomonas aromaticivorans]